MVVVNTYLKKRNNLNFFYLNSKINVILLTNKGQGTNLYVKRTLNICLILQTDMLRYIHETNQNFLDLTKNIYLSKEKKKSFELFNQNGIKSKFDQLEHLSGVNKLCIFLPKKKKLCISTNTNF